MVSTVCVCVCGSMYIDFCAHSLQMFTAVNPVYSQLYLPIWEVIPTGFCVFVINHNNADTVCSSYLLLSCQQYCMGHVFGLLQAFMPRLLHRCGVECFVTGNYSLAETLQLGQHVEKVLKVLCCALLCCAVLLTAAHVT